MIKELLIFFGSSLMMFFHHEEAHYEVARQYALEPEFKLQERKVKFTPPNTDGQEMDVLGAGFTAEQWMKKEYAQNKIYGPWIYSMFHLATFAYSDNSLYPSGDGQKYFNVSPGEKKKAKRAVLIEPLVFATQMYFDSIGSNWQINSWTEIDRRGIVSFYELSYRVKF